LHDNKKKKTSLISKKLNFLSGTKIKYHLQIACIGGWAIFVLFPIGRYRYFPTCLLFVSWKDTLSFELNSAEIPLASGPI
jgi:hypothetical protein